MPSVHWHVHMSICACLVFLRCTSLEARQPFPGGISASWGIGLQRLGGQQIIRKGLEYEQRGGQFGILVCHDAMPR